MTNTALTPPTYLAQRYAARSERMSPEDAYKLWNALVGFESGTDYYTTEDAHMFRRIAVLADGTQAWLTEYAYSRHAYVILY